MILPPLSSSSKSLWWEWSLSQHSLAVAAQGRPHPRLAEDWVETVLQPGLGVVYESYTMVDDYSFENPSGLWTNYTDDSCKRLIHVPSQERYYLKCYALDCCWDYQSGNHVEFQIPNVYPPKIPGQPEPEPWPVTDLGRRNVTTSFGETWEADAWFWDFAQASTPTLTLTPYPLPLPLHSE